MLALLFLVIPAVEIFVIIKVGALLGAWATLAIIAVTAFVGAALAKNQGTAVLKEMQASMAEGREAAKAIIEGVLVLVAGVTLLAPGFMTDVMGLALLIPPIRSALAQHLASKVRLNVGAPGFSGFPGGQSYDSEDPPPPGVIDI